MEVREVSPDEHDRAGQAVLRAYLALGDGCLVDGYDAEIASVAERASHTTVFVAVDAGEVIGAATYVGDQGSPAAERLAPDEAGIRFLGVDPVHQGRGAGRALLDACLARARAEGKRAVVLHTTEVMETARAMYVRSGFRRMPGRDFGGEIIRLLAYELVLDA